MSFRRPATVAAAALVGLGFALASTAPALANGSGGFVDAGDFNWYVGAGNGEWGVQLGYYDGPEYGAGNNLQNSQFVLLDPAGDADVVFACTGVTITEGSDFVIACNDTVTTPWGLSATSSARILAPGDLLRLDFVVTNTSDEPVRLDYSYNSDWGAITELVRSSEPSTVDTDPGELEPADIWAYVVGDEGTTPSGLAWGIDGAAATAVPFFGGDEIFIIADGTGATIAPDETVVVSFFHKLAVPDPIVILPPDESSTEAPADGDAEPALSSAAAPASEVMAEFANFDGRLTRGLPTDATVINWQPVAEVTDDEPELADTGVDAHAALFAAATLLGLGALLLLSRHRAQRA